MRRAEIANLTISAIDLKTGEIRWIGKARRPRIAVAGQALLAAIRRYLTEWDMSGHARRADDPLISRATGGGDPFKRTPNTPNNRLRYGGSPVNGETIAQIVLRRARLAGLGQVAPHDLRRSAAGILHNAKSADGAHLFDLLDIQKVLGHADPTTTMKSYIDPMDNEVHERAARFLD
jgi:integrase